MNQVQRLETKRVSARGLTPKYSPPLQYTKCLVVSRPMIQSMSKG
jgi:hypothetical protein